MYYLLPYYLCLHYFPDPQSATYCAFSLLHHPFLEGHLANFAFQSFRKFLTDEPAQKEAVMVRRVLMSVWGLGDKQMPLKRHPNKQPPIPLGYFIPSSKKPYTSVCYISGFPENPNPWPMVTHEMTIKVMDLCQIIIQAWRRKLAIPTNNKSNIQDILVHVNYTS